MWLNEIDKQAKFDELLLLLCEMLVSYRCRSTLISGSTIIVFQRCVIAHYYYY